MVAADIVTLETAISCEAYSRRSNGTVESCAALGASQQGPGAQTLVKIAW